MERIADAIVDAIEENGFILLAFPAAFDDDAEETPNDPEVQGREEVSGGKVVAATNEEGALALLLEFDAENHPQLKARIDKLREYHEGESITALFAKLVDDAYDRMRKGAS